MASAESIPSTSVAYLARAPHHQIRPAHPFGDVGLAQQQPGSPDRIGVVHLPRLGEDPGGLVELAGTEQHLAQRLGDVGEIGLVDGAGLGLAGGIQRPTIEARRLRGDGEITRSVAGQPTVDPRLIEPPGQVRMQGQRLGLLLHAAGFAFEGVVDRRDVQRPPEPEGQPFVGRIAQQRPTEPDVAVTFLLEELREALPGGGVGLRRVVVEDPAERLDGHADAEHRRAADQGAVLRRQTIDPSHRRRLDRVRQPSAPPEAAAASTRSCRN